MPSHADRFSASYSSIKKELWEAAFGKAPTESIGPEVKKSKVVVQLHGDSFTRAQMESTIETVRSEMLQGMHYHGA